MEAPGLVLVTELHAGPHESEGQKRLLMGLSPQTKATPGEAQQPGLLICVGNKVPYSSFLSLKGWMVSCRDSLPRTGK